MSADVRLGTDSTSDKNPGKNRSNLACVAVHIVRCCSSRLSSSAGGETRILAAFITKTTFFSDSETASY